MVSRRMIELSLRASPVRSDRTGSCPGLFAPRQRLPAVRE